MSKLNPIIHGKKVAAAFGSYGWSSEAVPRIEARLRELSMNLYSPGLRICFKPSEVDLKDAFDFGAGFAKKLSNKKSGSEMNPADVEKISGEGEFKYWKCVVCGGIFEGVVPPEICPVCGAGRDQFIEVKKKRETF